MMYLLDTNALLYYLYDESRFSAKARAIVYGDEPLAISIASLWEIAIKASLGKLAIKSTISRISETCQRENIRILPIRETYLDLLLTMNWHHRDPFDRLIIATAQSENLDIISSDQTLPQYSVPVIW